MDLSRLLITDAPAVARSPHAAADLFTALCETGHNVVLLSVALEEAPDEATDQEADQAPRRLSRIELLLDGTRVDCQRTARAWSIARIDADKRKSTATRLDAVQRRCVTSFFDRSTSELVASKDLLEAVMARGWKVAWRKPHEPVEEFASRTLGRPLKTHAFAPRAYINVRALVEAIVTVASTTA